MFFSSFSSPGKHSSLFLALPTKQIWGSSLFKDMKASHSCLEPSPQTQGTRTPVPQHTVKFFVTNWMLQVWTLLWKLMVTSLSFLSTLPTLSCILPADITSARQASPSPGLFTLQPSKGPRDTPVGEALGSLSKAAAVGHSQNAGLLAGICPSFLLLVLYTYRRKRNTSPSLFQETQ